MINAMNMKLMSMKKHDLMASYGKMMGMGEELEASEDATVVEQETPEVKYDYNDWYIILGYWLRRYCNVITQRSYQLESILRKNKFKSVHFLNYKIN